jgi:UDP-glucose 4-epimerase
VRELVVGCGFIGSHVVAELAARGRPPVVLARSRPDPDVASLIGSGDLLLGDAADLDAVEAALEGVGDVVYCAGGLLPAAAEQSPELAARLTLEPLRTVLRALRDRPGVGLSYISSGGTVYGEPARVPVSEDEPARPSSVYGKLHLRCEREIERERAAHGLRARVLRCSSVYGEYQRPERGQGAVATFLHRIEREEVIYLYGDGSTVRDYVYAGDVAAAIVDLLDRRDGPPVLNVGSFEGTSLPELVRAIEAQVGRPARVVAGPRRDFDVGRIVLDASRLRRLVRFAATPLPTGIARTHRWLTESAAAELA